MESFSAEARVFAGRARSRAISSPMADFKTWITDNSTTGVIFRASKEVPQSADQMEVSGAMLFHPHHLVDHRAAHWHKLWTSAEVKERSEVRNLFGTVQERARLEPLPPLDIDVVRRALRAMKARAGQGIDR
eukprot:1608582-Pyramimonas_sp.AAC.1